MPGKAATVDGGKWPTGWLERPADVAEVLGFLNRPFFGAEAKASHIQDSGKGKCVLLHKALITVSPNYQIHTQTVGDCLAPGTMVMGRVIKPIEQVEVGDEVWTGEGRMTRVVSTRTLQTVKPLVRIHSTGGLPLTCTADHKILVYRMARVGGKRVTSAYYARALQPNPTFAYKPVIECYEGRHAEWVPAGELTDTDYLLTPTGFDGVPVAPDAPGDLTRSAEGRHVLGFFIGNGHAGGGTVSFSGRIPERRDRLESALRMHRFHPKLEDAGPDHGAWGLGIHSRELVRWCRDQFYDGDKVKVFPSWAIGDRDFLGGLADSDGFSRGDCHYIDSTSLSIINGTMASLVSLGYDPAVGLLSRSAGTFDNAKPLYRIIYRDNKAKSYVWRDESFVCRPVVRVEFIEGPATVHDIGVADPHHSFIGNNISCSNCVSHGWSMGVDVLKAVQIVAGAREKYTGDTATEVIYAGSRVEVGKGGCGRGDGSIGAWAAKWVSEYGTVVRGKYGSIDLTTYSGRRAQEWGMPRAGVPDELEPIAREHPVKTVSLVTDYEQARDAIANGYCVPVCSNQGFASTRDEKGFARPRGSWGHCMLFLACDDADPRPGLLCQNSWGETWISGPTRHDQLPGSFWVDADTCTRMLRGQDSFALSSFVGFPAQDLVDFGPLVG